MPKPFSRSRSRCSRTRTWLRPAFALIADGEVAGKAWVAAVDPEIATYDQADDPYFRARASDLRDLRDRVLRRLAGEVDQAVPSGVIVAAEDMPPSVFLATDWRDGGLVLRRGSPSSHVAILARSRGVPMIVGVDIDHLESGVDAVLDGEAGTLIVDPDPEPSGRLRSAPRRTVGDRRGGVLIRRPGDDGERRAGPTHDQCRPGSPNSGISIRRRLDGIGLMRTEFLFQERRTAADRGRAVPDLPAAWPNGPPASRLPSARSMPAATSRLRA